MAQVETPKSYGSEKGTNVVVLDPDVAAVFRESQSVNQALRLLIDVAKSQAG